MKTNTDAATETQRHRDAHREEPGGRAAKPRGMRRGNPEDMSPMTSFGRLMSAGFTLRIAGRRAARSCELLRDYSVALWLCGCIPLAATR
jgi:hypothetical protein